MESGIGLIFPDVETFCYFIILKIIPILLINYTQLCQKKTQIIRKIKSIKIVDKGVSTVK